MQVYRHEQEERLDQKVVADIVMFYSKQEHATEISVAMEENQPMVDVSVYAVRQEHVATSKVGVILFCVTLHRA